jgi:hypothetical protein
MRWVLKCVSWLAMLGCCGLQWTLAAPVSIPGQPEAPAAAPAADESHRAVVGPARGGLRSDVAQPVEKTISSDVGTGQKNLDLLLDLEGRTGSGNAAGGEEARLEAARAARRRLLESGNAMVDKGTAASPKGVLAPAAGTGVELNESSRDPSTESRRWSGSVGTPRAMQDNGSTGSSDAPAHHNYSYGADFSNAPTRKLLLMLQEYREWVIAAAVVATLLALASGAASRTRRRR